MEKKCVVVYQKFVQGIFNGTLIYGPFASEPEAANWLLDKNFNFPDRSYLYLRNEGKFVIGTAKIIPLKAP